MDQKFLAAYLPHTYTVSLRILSTDATLEPNYLRNFVQCPNSRVQPYQLNTDKPNAENEQGGGALQGSSDLTEPQITEAEGKMHP